MKLGMVLSGYGKYVVPRIVERPNYPSSSGGVEGDHLAAHDAAYTTGISRH